MLQDDDDAPDQVKTGDGRILTVSISGADADHGWPVFLLHGTPGSRTGPRPRAGVLYRRGVRLISYDRPGYGGSSRQPQRQVADAADDVERIADELEIDRFSVVGRSGGGPHALACAARLPHRIHRAATLVGMAPNNPELDWFSGMTAENVSEFGKAADLSALNARFISKARRTAKDPRYLLERLMPQMTATDRAVVDDVTIQQLLVNAYHEAVRLGPYGWIDDVLALRNDWGFDPKSISVPVRIWHGIDDNFAPVSHARWLAEHIPGAELELESERAHFAAVEVLPRMLTWLSGGRTPAKAAGDARSSLLPAPA